MFQKLKKSLARLPVDDQIVFLKRLSMLLGGGLSIVEAFDMLKVDIGTANARHIILSLDSGVRSGRSLADCVKDFEYIFGTFTVNLIAVGEASGTLKESLEHVSSELKRRKRIRRAILNALMYPSLILCVTVVIAIFLMTVIFPKVIPLFQSVKMQLPISTVLLIESSAFVSRYYLHIIIGIIAVALSYIVALRSLRFRLFVDVALVRMPFLGNLSVFYNVASISGIISTLLQNNVPLPTAIKMTADSVRNSAYRQALENTLRPVCHGAKWSGQLSEPRYLFPPLMEQMVASGEASGTLPQSLKFVSEMYEEDLNEFAKNLTVLVEPVLMIIMGIVIGFIAMSIIAPLYSITQGLHMR